MGLDILPIEVLTIKETAYERLLHAIVLGKLPPGEQVTAAQLAEQMGVGLMPVREALRKLEAGNFISVTKSRRYAINKLSSDDLNELLEIRLTLECMASKKSVKNCTDETIRELEHLFNQMEATKKPEDYLEKNRQFHHALYQAAHMPILLETIKALWRRFSPYLHIGVTEVMNQKALAMTYHKGVLQGMREKDVKKVCKWISLDLKKAAELVAGVLNKEIDGK